MSQWRRCSTCRELQHPDQFPVDLSKKSGHKGVCVTCAPPPEPEPPKPSVPTAIRKAMCSRKRRYRTREFALAVATRAAKRTEFMRVYECPICKGWHLTHKAAKEAS